MSGFPEAQENLQFFDYLLRLIIAYGLALPIGWNREKNTRSAGLRTFPLVCVGACSYTLIGVSFASGDDALARIIYGVITGIGFIGGGAILKNKDGVSGTATAASIWNVGAIGVAVAVWRVELALVLSVVNIVTLHISRRLKSEIVRKCEGEGDD